MDKQLVSLRAQLGATLKSRNPDLAKCKGLFTDAKICMVQLGLLTPSHNNVDEELLKVAREVLVQGANYSARTKDDDAFEGYIAQLHGTFRNLEAIRSSPDLDLDQLTALHLLYLLSKNRLADFHIALEAVNPDKFEVDGPIKQVVDLEQCLMEGSYNKVLKTGAAIQGEEFKYFYNTLMDTVRAEIGVCIEEAYESLSVDDAGMLLHFKNKEDLLNFANKRSWTLNAAEGTYEFKSDDTNAIHIQQEEKEEIIGNVLAYARELERIV